MSDVKKILKQMEDDGKKGKSRGSVRNIDRLQAFASDGKTGDASWGDCSPDRLQAAIVGITQLGGAITVALSRDFGAHSLTLMLDGKKRTLWFNGNAALDDELDSVIDTLSQMG